MNRDSDGELHDVNNDDDVIGVTDGNNGTETHPLDEKEDEENERKEKHRRRKREKNKSKTPKKIAMKQFEDDGNVEDLHPLEEAEMLAKNKLFQTVTALHQKESEKIKLGGEKMATSDISDSDEDRKKKKRHSSAGSDDDLSPMQFSPTHSDDDIKSSRRRSRTKSGGDNKSIKSEKSNKSNNSGKRSFS